MKNIYISLLILISFVVGFFVSKIYFDTKLKIDNEIGQNSLLKSGVYEDLYFEYVRKEDNSYYIKFNKQKEDKKAPDYCYINGVFEEDDTKKGCFMTGRPLQEKLIPDIDLSKEYKFRINGMVGLITYDIENVYNLISMDISTFYSYINKKEEPSFNFYGIVIENPNEESFQVTMINGEIVNINQIYHE